MTKFMVLFMLVSLGTCEKLSEPKTESVCQILADPKTYLGQKVQIQIEATMLWPYHTESSAIISNPQCQNKCGYWSYSARVKRSRVGSEFLAEVRKRRAAYGVGVSADLWVSGHFSKGPKSSPELHVDEILSFKMRDKEDAPLVLCGSDMTKPYIGSCEVDAGACPDGGL